jgi:arylsulfatase
VHNYVGLEEHRVSSSNAVPPGAHTLAFRFNKTGEHQGKGVLFVDGTPAGQVEIVRFTPTRFSITGDGLTCGYVAGVPVCRDYASPFRFTGTLKRVTVDVDGVPFVDPQADAEAAIRSQ